MNTTAHINKEAPVSAMGMGLLRVFLIIWAATFLLYLPAANAGMVGDFPYWLRSIRTHSFWGYMSDKEVPSLYQFTQFTSYIFYQLFGTHPWPWHLLFITLHATNAVLLYQLLRNLFSSSGIKQSCPIAFAAVLLYTASPHLSETIVWEPSYHFLLAPLCIFSILILLQKFIKLPRPKYAIGAAVIYFLSSYSLEFFYLTPWIILFVILYYRYVVQVSGAATRKALLCFFVPALLLFVAHWLVLQLVFHMMVSHYGSLSFHNVYYYLSKPLKYLFHILCFGRFFSHDIKMKVYELCEKKKVIIAAYGLLSIATGIVLLRLRQTNRKVTLALLCAGFALMMLLFLSPLDFPDLFLVSLDRYVYLPAAFIFAALVLLLSLIPSRAVTFSIVGLYALVNVYFTLKVNNYWKDSAGVVKGMLNSFPDPGNKTVIMLNLPECLNGIPMIDAQPTHRFKLMMNMLTTRHINNTVYDAVAYNMLTAADGAHVTVTSDSTLKVTLNQWGTWWFYSRLGAGSYETPDYKVNMTDPGHWYELVLKHPAAGYLLLYQVGNKLKAVNMTNKTTDQD
ncbi:MAG: hypothetical protein V4649_11945 [Bacteroidota bacterium]